MTTILARSGKTETGEKKIVVDVKFLNFDSAKKAFIPAKDTASIRCMEAIGADAIEKTTKDMEKNILSVARAATDISKNFISSSFIADYSMWKESEKMIPKIDSIEDTSEEI